VRSGGFAARVYSVVSRIPAGKVATYGDVAHLAGHPRASRAVGQLMRTAAKPGLPYHRVVAADGKIGGYGPSGTTMKAALLKAEGLTIRAGRIVDFRNVRVSVTRRRPDP
jgi:O-6-methylguanine DNA methyltransferase